MLIETGTFHSSVVVLPEALVPPPEYKAKRAVPLPLPSYLAVAKSATSVQDVPFHDSVSALELFPGFTVPPNANAEVLLLAATPTAPLAVFKLFPSVQDVPFQSSVLLVGVPLPSTFPPVATASVTGPPPAI